MSDLAIRVDGLGKRYRLGRRERYRSLRDTVARVAGAPLRLFRRNPAAEDSSPGNFWALKDVSFELRHGEVLGVIGRNGAGKSTLLKILSRITEPTAGQVELFGRVASLLEVGTGFHPELTGRENIYLNGAVLGMTRQEIARKFDEIVGFAEVEEFLDTAVKHYSSGMYMRLAFAVAAHLEPEILLVDEVLAVGDAAFQAKCLGKMGQVAAHGRTVLFVSHNMGAVERLCRKVLLLDRGRVVRYTADVADTIVDYLFGRGSDDGRAEWTNPGNAFENPWFCPHLFRLADPAGKGVGGPIRNDAEVWLEIEADVATLDPSLTVGCALYNEEGFLLYWSYQTDGAEADWPRLRPGRNVLRSQIPRRLLNEGTYRLELTGGLHCRQWLFEPGVSAPAIYFTIQGGLSDSPMWAHRRPGALAPVIRWEVR